MGEYRPEKWGKLGLIPKPRAEERMRAIECVRPVSDQAERRRRAAAYILKYVEVLVGRQHRML